MQPGQQITPSLRLVRLLGRGGMGSVWVADHLTLGTQVAIKFMSPAYVENQALVQRFSTEAKAAAQIKSPHVAQVFDHGVMTDGTPYIVMELLEGEDLKRRIRREGPLPPRDVSLILTQVCKALGRAHQLGIVHRDIKPDNIFLTYIDGDLLVKVLDFGIAKLGAGAELGSTTTGSMMGTPLYMGPEQLLSAKRVDHRADLWSLAVVAYHALTGRVPFSGETVGALSVAVYTGVFELPSRLRPGLSPALDAWFQRALRKDPNERFGTAKELSETLDAALTGQVASMRTPLPSYAEGTTTSAQIPATTGYAPPTMPSSFFGAGSETGPGTGPGPTLVGASATRGARTGATKTALLVAGLVALLAGVLAFAAFGIAGRADEPTLTTAQGAATTTAVPTSAPTIAPATAPEPAVSPNAPAPTGTASAEAPAAKEKPGGNTGKTPSTTRAPSPPPTSTTKPPAGGKKPDDIGF